MHCNTLKQDNDSTVRGDRGSRVGEVRASTTSPMPEHKGFAYPLIFIWWHSTAERLFAVLYMYLALLQGMSRQSVLIVIQNMEQF